MESLDAHAENTTELRPWVNRIDMKNAPDPENVPYRMFLLTISPAIVLVVPITPSSSDYYKNRCDTLLFKGCIQSQGFRGSAYWFHDAPPVVNRTFWFTTEEQPGAVHFLKDGQSVHEIAVAQATVRLSSTNARWEVHRVK
jgi:DNA polymerase III alpha subunit (gram-positive type)